MGILVVAFVVFVAVLALAPQQATQIFLMLAWAGGAAFALFQILKWLGGLLL